MRNSWIDKKELDELVGGFSSATGKSRRKGHVPLADAGELGLRGGGNDQLGEAGVEEGTESVGALLESGPGLDQNPLGEDPPRVEGNAPEEGVAVGMEANGGPFLEPILETRDAEEYFPPEREDFDSWELESEFGPFELIEDTQSPGDAMMGTIDVGMEEELEEDVPEPANSVRSEGVVLNLVVEDAADDGPHSRKIPTFLGGLPEPPEVRQQPLSARDADRAHTALAEARARVDQSRLLWTAPQERPDSTRIETEAETAPESGDVDQVGKVNDVEETASEAGRYLYARLEVFGDLVQRELGATEVAVCDEDGLLLYKSPGFGSDRTLQNSLLLHISGRTNALIGTGRDGVSQVTDGGGTWSCLIPVEGYQGILFAGLTLREPLDQREIEFWRNALVETSAPSRPIC